MSRFAPPDGMSRADLKLLHVYRKAVAPPDVAYAMANRRWRRVLDEVIAEIARTATPLEGVTPQAAVLARLERLAELGYLIGDEPEFSLYKLTQQGTALLDRWKKADYS